jgi:hypothetical protein
VKALTITETASRLRVSRQRVSQLLTSGALTGPPQPSGVRAPPNAPRVYLASVEAEQKRRVAGRPASTRAARDQASEAMFGDDVYRLKLALDVARDLLARQREQNEKLASLLAGAVAALQQEQALAREAEQITEAYATIANTHLAPHVAPPQA